MDGLDEADLREIVKTAVRPWAEKAQVDPARITDDTNLFAAGVLDSLAFLELMETIQARTGRQIALELFDDGDIETLGGLVRQIARVLG